MVPAARPQVVVRPAVVVHRDTEKERRVGDASGEHRFGTGGERVAHHVGTEVGVGRRHAWQQRLERLARVEQQQLGVRRSRSATSSPMTAAQRMSFQPSAAASRRMALAAPADWQRPCC